MQSLEIMFTVIAAWQRQKKGVTEVIYWSILNGVGNLQKFSEALAEIENTYRYLQILLIAYVESWSNIQK